MKVINHRQKIKDIDSKVPIILAVEDDFDNLLLISHTLISFQLNFVTARDGKTALEIATKYQIDLMLLDLVLPDINGFDLIKQLKQSETTKEMPIIVVSGLVEKRDRDRAFAQGCSDYLSKPYFINDLETTIDRHLA